VLGDFVDEGNDLLVGQSAWVMHRLFEFLNVAEGIVLTVTFLDKPTTEGFDNPKVVIDRLRGHFGEAKLHIVHDGLAVEGGGSFLAQATKVGEEPKALFVIFQSSGCSVGDFAGEQEGVNGKVKIRSDFVGLRRETKQRDRLDGHGFSLL
jgi:hypothetical protein